MSYLPGRAAPLLSFASSADFSKLNFAVVLILFCKPCGSGQKQLQCAIFVSPAGQAHEQWFAVQKWFVLFVLSAPNDAAGIESDVEDEFHTGADVGVV